MLIKVQYRGLKKYLKLQPGFSYESFIEEEFVPAGENTSAIGDAAEKAKWMVQEVLEKSSGGEETMEEYKRLSTLTHCTRRHHILVSHIVEMHGNSGSHSSPLGPWLPV
ncbi:hypothetical protein AALO_G00175860 [Alosa alosa]|uniref:Uncharacterized protein n=2 Tax=Alosa alosa TaxID=278164 RepID=A0AAV6G7J5_9TELE|nr:hypothetical protein AALO_G00175860 [Alosa alosa]